MAYTKFNGRRNKKEKKEDAWKQEEAKEKKNQ